jgi:hypothetical protein
VNAMGRGGAWERAAQLEMIDANGLVKGRHALSMRVHGQMTRGFPQHALRLTFKSPVVPWNEAAGGAGYRSLVLRAAGNDQVKAMLRDAYQHSLCKGLPFEVSAAWPSVLYVNGAYWGVHHLRERVDHVELARRHGLPQRDIAVVEDAAVPYKGDPAQAGVFMRLVKAAERGDPQDPKHMEMLEAALDVDGFLTYMAAQMILGNMDWPEQNVRYWRYVGTAGPGVRDGRWRFIMGDTDLSFGANASAATDPLIRVRHSQAPVARLFRALMKSPEVAALFDTRVAELLEGPLSTDRMVAELDRFVELMAPEMDRHTARWRKPTDVSAWRREVEVMRDFARERGELVRQAVPLSKRV